MFILCEHCLILNALNNFSHELCNRFIKNLLYNNTTRLLKKKSLYGRMSHSFLVNNFHKLLRKTTATKTKNNKNFAFPINESGQNFVKIMNLHLQCSSRKLAGSYNAKDTLSTKSPTKDNIKNEHR